MRDVGFDGIMRTSPAAISSWKSDVPVRSPEMSARKVRENSTPAFLNPSTMRRRKPQSSGPSACTPRHMIANGDLPGIDGGGARSAMP